MIVTLVTLVAPLTTNIAYINRYNNDDNNDDVNDDDYNNMYCIKCNKCNIFIYENNSFETQCYTGFQKPEPHKDWIFCLNLVWTCQDQCNMGFLEGV